MYKAVVIGGGWSGCAAALAARKAGAEVYFSKRQIYFSVLEMLAVL